MSVNLHSAKASMLGYRFQPLYALLVLWDEAKDDFDHIAIEAEDDVVLNGSMITLFQLKHSLKSTEKLSIKNDGFWKTLRIWAPYSKLSNYQFVFVTAAQVEEESSLICLTDSKKSREKLLIELLKEAKMVRKSREDAAKQGKKLPYETRVAGCEAFLNLKQNERESLLDRIIIRPNTFNIEKISEEVQKRLGKMVVHQIRPMVAERLLEWWDRKVLKDKDMKIKKVELLSQLQNIISQHLNESLPDDYSKLYPKSYKNEIGITMEKQIDLVKGGESRKKRAAIARWRARNQRERWMGEDLLSIYDLEQYDEHLIEVWKDRHEPMAEDLEGELELKLVEEGRRLLDWSHNESYISTMPPRSEWRHQFLAQGSYQQLAEEMKVGWHPKYEELLNSNKVGDSNDSE